MECDAGELQRLLKAGADPDVFASNGHTPLVAAVGQGSDGEAVARPRVTELLEQT
jgi:hypothetical protein